MAAAGIAANPDDPRDAVGDGVSASVNAAVARTMLAAMQGKPIKSFPAPDRSLAFG
ncbi:hypothetical protein GCM10027605_54530 [Micromonospora zhanjiangensis]